jgi:hypothetical protein
MRYLIIFFMVLFSSVCLFFLLAAFIGGTGDMGVLIILVLVLIFLAAFIISQLCYIIDLLQKR